METIMKNFRGFFSQSSLNALTTVVAAAAAEARSGDIAISARAQNFLTLGSMVLGFAHLLVNSVPDLHTADVEPINGAPYPGSLTPAQVASAPVAALAAPEPAPVMAPAPVVEPAPAPVSEPAPAPVPVAAAADGLAAVMSGLTG